MPEPKTQAEARAEHDAFMKHAAEAIVTSQKLKLVMQGKGITAARAECPRCGNETLQGRLAGRKQHMRMWCTTEGCDMPQMME